MTMFMIWNIPHLVQPSNKDTERRGMKWHAQDSIWTDLMIQLLFVQIITHTFGFLSSTTYYAPTKRTSRVMTIIRLKTAYSRPIKEGMKESWTSLMGIKLGLELERRREWERGGQWHGMLVTKCNLLPSSLILLSKLKSGSCVECRNTCPFPSDLNPLHSGVMIKLTIYFVLTHWYPVSHP